MFCFTVTGCADLTAPDHAWHKREGNVATVGCQHQNKTWHLKCEGDTWDGVVGSCNETGQYALGCVLLIIRETCAHDISTVFSSWIHISWKIERK